LWASGNDAIVVTFDEGNTATDKIVTVIVTNHGPRGIKDNTSYDPYSLLASLQQTFDLGCLLNSCSATAMAPLFQITGSNRQSLSARTRRSDGLSLCAPPSACAPHAFHFSSLPEGFA
jgi:hypothetical protein